MKSGARARDTQSHHARGPPHHKHTNIHLAAEAITLRPRCQGVRLRWRLAGGVGPTARSCPTARDRACLDSIGGIRSRPKGSPPVPEPFTAPRPRPEPLLIREHVAGRVWAVSVRPDGFEDGSRCSGPGSGSRCGRSHFRPPIRTSPAPGGPKSRPASTHGRGVPFVRTKMRAKCVTRCQTTSHNRRFCKFFSGKSSVLCAPGGGRGGGGTRRHQHEPRPSGSGMNHRNGSETRSLTVGARGGTSAGGTPFRWHPAKCGIRLADSLGRPGDHRHDPPLRSPRGWVVAPCADGSRRPAPLKNVCKSLFDDGGVRNWGVVAYDIGVGPMRRPGTGLIRSGVRTNGWRAASSPSGWGSARPRPADRRQRADVAASRGMLAALYQG